MHRSVLVALAVAGIAAIGVAQAQTETVRIGVFDPETVWRLTIKQNTVAIVTDGTAVLGLGDIGPEAALPVMEGKAMLFKEFGNVDAWPICLATTDPDEIVRTVVALAPAFGGINRFDFENDRIRITPLQMTTDCMQALTDSLVLIFTGLTRHASATLDEQLHATKEQRLDKDLQHLIVLANQAVTVLEGNSPELMLQEFGAMMHEGWQVKRALSSKITNPHIDQLYDQARKHGALGGKLSGAGSGGFLLMVVPAHAQLQLAEAIAPARLIKISMDVHGSTVLYS